ncbi:MAG: hypothetical protein A2653_00910 [Candidatus Zambryskibacteria bacterium RIFCSPHIGHO2_01_FULL_43_25]|uniref:Signal peptidase I n=1 Tax=Candidatus Zambryskibacteria bacterium RIFCSPLOWO2_01_FULL_45_21 TaxID=1802761 RepID=A0A1G2U4Q5_9BACT|nr:MAG: hypothetical protein A2653_00910 [Candidatus Zambryskibacteria bacterium RIFCSPHIGHO2_01_FULL_43_25]OHB00644.1 MAG: hypothetical protein A3E94_03395 [Candidatus Zambryskibacteria bacterium RIFCSPHIGHO2_12_FULL_44_12b]OHB04459.1 MAG: hypothetical protein A3B14_03435 [Candidatus Zambryskibacteria bacterium RIFCSPLOWO2_01_FULL_45_21]
MTKLLLIVLVIAGMAGVFRKAGKPWWGAIIPIYNIYLLIKVSRTSVWWFWASFIPLVSVTLWGITMFFGTASGGSAFMVLGRLTSLLLPIAMILGIVALVVIGLIVPSRISRVFGHGIGMSLGLILLPFIFYPILGFNKSFYQPVSNSTQ